MSGVISENRLQQVHHHQCRTHNRPTCILMTKKTRFCYNYNMHEYWILMALCVLLVCSVMVSGAAVVGVGSDVGGQRASICDTVGCNCSAKAVVWTVVNCTLQQYQDMQIQPRTVPDNIIELSIIATSAGSSVTIHADAFLALRGFSRLLIDGAHALRMRTHSVHNLTTSSVVIQVRRCDIVWLERGAIKNSETSVIIEISNSEVVTVEGSAFSRLQEAHFTDVTDLQLHEGAFTFEHMRTHGRHGPVTNVSFHNVAIPHLPRACFSSALAEINIRDSRISEVQAEAFKAKEISTIIMSNSSIGRMRSRAMIDDLHVVKLVISKSHIHVVETGAVAAAFTNFHIEHSRLDVVQPNGINTPVVANVDLQDNEFRSLTSHSFTFNNWNHIRIKHNIIKHLHANFLDIAETTTAEEFTFDSNEVYNMEDNSLRFVADLERLATPGTVMVFANNFFNQTCHCDIGAWLSKVVNSSDVGFIVNSSFCTVDALLSNCFELPEGLINMRNFTELVCGPESYIKCEPYNGETKVLDTTAIMLLDDISQSNSSQFVLYLTLGCLFIVAIIATVIILLVRGAIWLDHKGYCDRFKLQYSSDPQADNDDNQEEEVNQSSNDADLLTSSSSHSEDQPDFPDELTPELLQNLREKLEDPTTHEQAREMIEKLYEMFIVDDVYTNNNRAAQQQHDDEAHLYEELGLNNHQPNKLPNTDMSDFSNNLLKLMENFLPSDEATAAVLLPPPKLVNEYSEPSDAEFHVYSELKQCANDTGNSNTNDGVKTNNERKDSLKSTGSSTKMASRPLPAKPTTATAGGEAALIAAMVVDRQRAGTSGQQYKF